LFFIKKTAKSDLKVLLPLSDVIAEKAVLQPASRTSFLSDQTTKHPLVTHFQAPVTLRLTLVRFLAAAS